MSSNPGGIAPPTTGATGSTSGGTTPAAAAGGPRSLPPDVTYLLGEQTQRDLAAIIYRLTSDQQFREQFAGDPAQTLVNSGMQASATVVDVLHSMDRGVMDRIIGESRGIITRSGAFTVEGERAAIVPLVAAFLAGMVASEMYHHRI